MGRLQAEMVRLTVYTHLSARALDSGVVCVEWGGKGLAHVASAIDQYLDTKSSFESASIALVETDGWIDRRMDGWMNRYWIYG